MSGSVSKNFRTRHNTEILWRIQIFNPAKQPPLPLESWQFVLDWANMPESYDEEVLNLVMRTEEDTVSPAHGETLVIVSNDSSMPDDRIFRFRKYFKRESEEDNQKKLASRPHGVYFGEQVFSHPDYIENCDGTPLSRLDVIKKVSGNSEIVLLDDPESVLTRGPCAAKNIAVWTVETANKIDHYLKLCEYLYNSSWLNAPIELSYTQPSQQHLGQFKGSRLPHWEQVLSVAAFFRQLCCAPDSAFEMACNCYMRHASDELKIKWIKARKQIFRTLMNSPNVIPSVKGITRAQLLEILLYGTHLLHATSDKQADAMLVQLCQQQHGHEIIAAIQFALRDLLHAMLIPCRVINQDFVFWIQNGLTAPTNPDLLWLFFAGETSRK